MSFEGRHGDRSSKHGRDPVNDKVLAAQVHQLYAQAGASVVAAIISAATLAVALRDVVSYPAPIVWLAGYLLLQGPRLSLIKGFQRASPEGQAAAAWGRWFIVTTTASSLMWGLAGVVLFPEVSVRHQFLLALFVAGMSAAATVVYAPRWSCSFPAIMCMLVPLSLRFYYMGGEENLTIGSVILIFAVVLVLVAKQMYERTAESIRLGFEKSDLIDSLTNQVLRAERLNESLKAEIQHHQKTGSALRDSEERYRQLVDLSPDGIYVSVGGVVVFVNNAAAKIMGATCPSQLVGRSSVDLFAPRQRGFVEQRLRMVYEERKAVPLVELLMVRSDGSNFYAEVAAAPINYDGQAASQVVVRDVTERKRAEAEILSSRERLRYLMSSSPAVIYSVNPLEPQAPTFVSENVRKQLGYEPGDLTGNPSFWISHIHPDDVPDLDELLPLLRERGHYAVEYRFRHKDGAYRWIRDEMNLIKDAEGRCVEIVGSGLDITEHKRAEEQLKRSLEEKEILLREIHHRVKNNLQVISSLLRLQSRYIADESYKRMFLEGQNRLDSMVLIHELLYRSDNLARVDVRGYIRGLAHLLFSTFGVGMTRIRFEADVAPVSMSMDTAIPCGLIVNELLSNCLKHAFADGSPGVIRVVLNATGDEFELAVADSGAGLPEGLDLETATTLGLRLVHTLVKQLQGEVAVHRSTGTEFRIRFKEIARTVPGSLVTNGELSKANYQWS